MTDLTFTVMRGEVFGYLGPNGAGKTTTIRTLLDFIRPTDGRASVLGLDSRRDAVEIHRRRRSALGVVLALAIAFMGPPFEVSISISNVVAAVTNCVLLALAFGSVAHALGAATGRRSVAIGITAGVAAGSYLIDVLALSVNGLGWLQRLSPFFYYREPDALANGLDPWAALVLAGIALIATAFAVVAFDRRDLAA